MAKCSSKSEPRDAASRTIGLRLLRSCAAVTTRACTGKSVMARHMRRCQEGLLARVRRSCAPAQTYFAVPRATTAATRGSSPASRERCEQLVVRRQRERAFGATAAPGLVRRRRAWCDALRSAAAVRLERLDAPRRACGGGGGVQRPRFAAPRAAAGDPSAPGEEVTTTAL